MVVERCCDMGDGMVDETVVWSSKGGVVVCCSCRRAARWRWQIASLDGEVHEIEVHALGYEDQVDAVECETEIDQVVTQGYLG